MKAILVLATWVLAFVPVYTCLWLWNVLDPTSFLEKLATIALFCIGGGTVQLLLLCVAVILTDVILEEE